MRSFVLKIENPHSHNQGTGCCCCYYTVVYSTLLHCAINVLIIRLLNTRQKIDLLFRIQIFSEWELFPVASSAASSLCARIYYTKKCPESWLSLSWTQHKLLCCTLYNAVCYVVLCCDAMWFNPILCNHVAIIAYSTVDTPSCSAQFSKCLITSRDSITNLNEWFVIFFINRVRAQSSISIATQANLFHVVLNKLEHC